MSVSVKVVGVAYQPAQAALYSLSGLSADGQVPTGRHPSNLSARH
jgi:hypothetical protein